jgi:ABC-type nitrate/sulfonate/bicarbonate transport system substrate-binding protein
LIAAERGYFEDVGIEVTITVPVTPLRALGYAAEGLTDIAVSHQPEVIFERENGTPVVAIGSLISRPTAALIWLERSKIRNVADLEGKTIAVPDLYFQEKFLGALLEEGGLTLEDVEIESIGYDLVAALVDGEADAIFDGSWNLEGAELEAQGLNPIVTRVQTTDIPAYDELVLAARTRQVSREPQLIRDFLSAVARGNAAAARDPRGVVELIEKSGETDPRLDRKGLEAAVRTTLPLLSRTGYMDPARADGLVDWMYEEGMIEQVPPTADLFTNSCLPPS